MVIQSYTQIFSAWWVTTILYNYGAMLCELRYYKAACVCSCTVEKFYWFPLFPVKDLLWISWYSQTTWLCTIEQTAQEWHLQWMLCGVLIHFFYHTLRRMLLIEWLLKLRMPGHDGRWNHQRYRRKINSFFWNLAWIHWKFKLLPLINISPSSLPGLVCRK